MMAPHCRGGEGVPRFRCAQLQLKHTEGGAWLRLHTDASCELAGPGPISGTVYKPNSIQQKTRVPQRSASSNFTACIA
eukprot:CAMPEP_0195107206 /NCGR_PEP_ID=MMETSP0448-20130528/81945_1 /TAXON_ID=66468 /ORGANISM="Heterocapsa triquestra, Strain CCMP 448" /LENGTH=77 /DNA_ID=CAMNT_0040143617 /DNA_START=142 /DNA_END=372 /DNA_ORIENTATION=+